MKGGADAIQAVPCDPVPTRATVRASSISPAPRGTRVRLPDGYSVTLFGRIPKSQAVHNALDLQARGYASETTPATEGEAS